MLHFLTRVGAVPLYACLLGLAVTGAIWLAHLFFSSFNGGVPLNTAPIAALTALSIGGPMLLLFVASVDGLRQSNEALLVASERLDRNLAQVAEAREVLAQANGDLEERVRGRTADLERAVREAREANAAKSMFLANMSHELRTPLNGIIGFAELIAMRHDLLGTFDEAQITDYAESIRSSGNHLHELVSDLLDLSKIGCGKRELDIETLETAPFVRDVARSLSHDAAPRGQRLVLDLENAPARFQADRRAIRQVLTNLLSNALKFSGDGSPVHLAAAGNGDGIEFAVIDRGIGMSPHAVQNATQPFARFSDAHIASNESVGLGLAIVSDLCALHGGTLMLESEKDKGTTARVFIPAQTAAAELAIAS